MIKNNRPYTDENGWIDESLVTDLSPEEQKIVIDWVKTNISPRKTVLFERTSYGMKHILESDTGIYLTNNQFKDAMLMCGFKPVDSNALNWNYCISKKSKAFDWKARRGW